jgi:penicillin amidase
MRRLLNGLGILSGLVVVAGVSAYTYLRGSLPQLDGTVSVSGLSRPVDIVRDRDTVTHVFAATRLDALFGLGYAHAQDRLWQMEFQRRVGHARLSEIFGATTLATDRFLRTLGTGRAARSAWNALPVETKTDVDSYVAGINAFISTHHGRDLPLEFTVLRFEPEPWTGPDVLAWVKMMAWDLSKNYSIELLRHDLLGTVGAGRTADLLPAYPGGGLTILNAADMPWMARARSASFTRSAPGPGSWPAQAPRASASSAAVQGPDAELRPAGADLPTNPLAPSWSEAFASTTVPGTGGALGSNNWVVDGTMTASGKPLLANDPHLNAQIPSLWYLAHLSAGDFDVIGATLPGAPAIAIGRNRRIAWGETNVMGDVEDLFRERLDPAGTSAEYRGKLEPLQIVRETIGVKGSAPVAIDVRISRHGPLISDAVNANNAGSTRLPHPQLEPLAFRWTALDREDTTILAFLNLNQARNWNEFTAALRDFVVPSQNFVYADVDGHIGYYAPGRFPVRASGDGSAPADGWTGSADWTGWVPFDELPHAFDPPEHFIVSANEKPVPPDYPHAISGEWTEPYRAKRIVDLLTGRLGLTVSDFASMQSDTLSLHGRALLPVLLARVHPTTAEDRQAVSLLRQWNGDERGDSTAAAIFQAWYYELVPAVTLDKLGPQLTASYQELDRNSYVSRFLEQTFATADNLWCDDARTPAKESCDDRALAALQAGLARLTRQFGRDMTRWRWDEVHRAVFAHAALDTVPLLGRLLRRTAPHGGDWSTVNVGPVFAPKPFEQRSLPGYRQIVDLSAQNDSRFLDAVGQSGNVFSPQYADALAIWSAGGYRRMRMDRAEVERGAIGHLRLIPR